MKVDEKGWAERRHSLKVYIPARCAIILAPFEHANKYPEIKLPDYDPEDPAFKPYIAKPLVNEPAVSPKKETKKAEAPQIE